MDERKVVSSPKKDQGKVDELAAILGEEKAALPSPNAQQKVISQKDQQPGEYWMSPSKDSISKMSHSQRQNTSNFTIGREGVSQIHFNTPVNLNNVNLDSIFNNLVKLQPLAAI